MATGSGGCLLTVFKQLVFERVLKTDRSRTLCHKVGASLPEALMLGCSYFAEDFRSTNLPSQVSEHKKTTCDPIC